ncbi:MAG: PD-(D/E)XK nuclease family protein [Sulfurovum sp.]
MKRLHIYPTSRALRRVVAQHKEQNGFIPALMRIDEFERRSTLIPKKTQIDPLQRVIFLRQSAKFEAFENLKVDLSLVRFFTKSDALFKFFEELSGEQVSFATLATADAYIEFESHLEILEKLLKNYKQILDKEGFIDKAFIPASYHINKSFIKSYSTIEIHLEGYLSRFELELIDKISQYTKVLIYYTTSKFNLKMQERFEDIGVIVPNNSHICFDMSSKEIVSTEPNDAVIIASIFSTEERIEQVALAFAQIEEMVSSGISPDDIVLILPDESIKEQFMIFDRYHNLNFAMGYDYSKKRVYKSLDAIYRYWQSREKEDRFIVERYGFDIEVIDNIPHSKKCEVDSFFLILDGLKLLDAPLIGNSRGERYNQRVEESYIYFSKIFEKARFTPKEWLFLWLKSLGEITIDDVRGGMITVMGVLETRGVAYEGVVIIDFNESIVPSSSSKDQFLNSSVRSFANLPTKHDRESLQKQYYKRLLEQASSVSIIYSTSENRLPSKFLYELGLDSAIAISSQLNLLYNEPSQIITPLDPVVENFNAFDIVWSASRLKTYLDCQRKYYYRYIQKIKPQKEEAELNEGSFLHSLLDHLHRENDSYQTAEEMQKQIDILLDTLLPYDSAKLDYQKLLWREKLKGYIDTQIDHFAQGYKVVEREIEFQGEIGGLKFKGRIDRIDQTHTETLVIDYKTGSTAEANKSKNIENLTDLQMSIYYLILKEKYSNIDLVFLKIFERGKLEEITALEEKNHLLGEKIIELKQTTSFVAKKCEELPKCKYCEFTLMCGRGDYL